jgi:hypothetical protein
MLGQKHGFCLCNSLVEHLPIVQVCGDTACKENQSAYDAFRSEELISRKAPDAGLVEQQLDQFPVVGIVFQVEDVA